MSQLSPAEKDQHDRLEYASDHWTPEKLGSGTKLYVFDYKDEKGVIHSGTFEDTDENGEKYMRHDPVYMVKEDQMNEFVDYDDSKEDENGRRVITKTLDAETYADAMQMKPFLIEMTDENGNTFKKAVYPNHVSVYEVPDGVEIDAETAIAEANPSYGHGGAREYFLQNSEWEKLNRNEKEEKEFEVSDYFVDKEVAENMIVKGRFTSFTGKMWLDDNGDEYEGLSEEDIADLEGIKTEFRKAQQAEATESQESDTEHVIDR